MVPVDCFTWRPAVTGESSSNLAAIFQSARPRRRGRLSPASLLRAAAEVVSFQGRDAELGALREWCLETDSVSLRLVKGSGGQGKTRLALELVHSMAGDGWAAGFLAPDAAEEPVDLTPIADSGVPVLVVIDYAETRTPQIRRLLPLLWESSDDSPPVRVLLLARSEGEWWERLRTDLDDLLGDVIPLLPLEESPTARIESFENAVEAFAQALPDVDPSIDWSEVAGKVHIPDDLDADRYGIPLTLQMSALLALLESADRRNENQAATLGPNRRS